MSQIVGYTSRCPWWAKRADLVYHFTLIHHSVPKVLTNRSNVWKEQEWKNNDKVWRGGSGKFLGMDPKCKDIWDPHNFLHRSYWRRASPEPGGHTGPYLVNISQLPVAPILTQWSHVQSTLVTETEAIHGTTKWTVPYQCWLGFLHCRVPKEPLAKNNSELPLWHLPGQQNN